MKRTLQTLFASMMFVLVVLCTFLFLIFKLGKKEQEITQQIHQERIFLNAATELLTHVEEMVTAGRGYYMVNDLELFKNFQLSRIRVLTKYKAFKEYQEYKQLPIEITEQLQLAFTKRLQISDSITKIAGKNTSSYDLSKVVVEGNRYGVLLNESIYQISKNGIQKISKLENQSSSTPRIQQTLYILTIIILTLTMISGFLYLLRNSKARIRAQEYLRSYRQSNHFLNSLTEGIVVQDISGRIIESNSAAAAILGLTIEQMYGRTSIDPRWRSIHEDGTDFPGSQHPAMQVLATGNSVENIIMGVHKPSGELTWIRIDSHPVKNNRDGRIVSAVTNFTDITTQKIKDDQLKQSEFLMKSSMQAIKHGFHMLDRQYHAVLVNNASKEILFDITGKAPDIGDCVLDFVPGGRKEAVKEVLQKVFNGDSVEYEVYYELKQPAWILYSISPVKDKDARTQYACVMFKEITDQKEKEQKVKEDEERLRMALERTGDNAWEHNFKTGITWFSSTNNHLLGYSTEELNIESNKDYWWRQTHPEDKHLLEQNDQEYRAGLRTEHSIEYRIYHKEGSLKWVLDRGVVIEWDTHGKPLRIVGTHTDISEAKWLQEELLKQEQQKKKEIVEAVIQAQEKEREEIAKELHEDIAQVLSSVKMLLTAADKNVLKEGKAAVSLANERISSVVDEIRLISQNINSSTLQQVGLKNAILDIVSRAEIISSIAFEFETKKYNEQREADFSIELTLLRLLQVMIKNIVRHSEATEAQVELYNDDQYIHLTVYDNGKGFQFEHAVKGLGIQTIINRAEQYGGHVDIISSPGTGCFIRVTMPLSYTSEPKHVLSS